MSSLFDRIYLNHANLNKKLHLIAGTVAGWHYSDKVQATLVHTTAGVFPAKESPEEIDQIFETLATKGEQHGRISKQRKRK